MIVRGGFKHYNVGWFLFVFMVVGFFAALLLPNILRDLQKARESEVKVILSSILTAQKVYHREYAIYSDNFRAIGFVPEGDLGTSFFLKSDEIPSDLAKFVGFSEEPFVKKDRFRALAIMESGPRVILYTIDQEGNIDRRDAARGNIRKGW